MTRLPRAPRRRAFSRAAPWSAPVVLALGLVLVGCAPGEQIRPADAASPAPSASTTPSAPAVSASPPSPVATAGQSPARIVLPTLGLDEPLIDLGITADGDMEVPSDYDDVGWFSGGGRPGGRGPVVIAGHVDSPTGPAVFIRLSDLTVGDPIEVVDSAGVVHRYVVTETADYPKSAFPTARVFGAVADDEVRLITCGGVFDATSGSYDQNRVVYAVRV